MLKLSFFRHFFARESISADILSAQQKSQGFDEVCTASETLDNSSFFFYLIFFMKQKLRLSSELHIVVAGCRFPHFKHVDRVIVVSQPALTREVKLTFLTLIQEYSPLTGLNG